jgi:hypothetical protein
MQVGNARLMISDNGSDVTVNNITPAELVLLATEHMVNVKKYPITDLKVLPNREAASLDQQATFFEPEDEEVLTKEKKVGELKSKPTFRKRSDQDEMVRLTKKYGQKKVESLWPGASPSLPQTFVEAEKIVNSRKATAPALVDVTTSEATVPSTLGKDPGPPPLVTNPPATPPAAPAGSPSPLTKT